MPSPVLGDFLAAADGRIAAATLGRDGHVLPFAAAAGDLGRLVTLLSRYCADLAPCDEIEASGRSDLHPWERAVIDSGAALRIAREYLRRGAQHAGGAPAGTAPGQARHLAAAAAELAAGRDLMHTHRVTDPSGLTRDRSEWAPVINSLPVLRALTSEVGRWSRQLAPFAALLANSAAPDGTRHRHDYHVPVPACSEVVSASVWLEAAGAAALAAQGTEPVRPADTELLYSIPAMLVPPRRRPEPGEPVCELCDGIAVSASRLRSAMRDSAERARWSPGVTSGGWQWMTRAAAVTCHLTEMALRSLAIRAGELAGPPASSLRLNEAADSAAGMREAWRQVDCLWDEMVTERRLLQTPTMTDASDLLLRLGRIVWENPHWTPARAERSTLKPPAVLAPGPADVTAVLAAVHEAADALALVAKAEGQAVEAAAAAGRLYVPTRSLPEEYDVPRPFAPAPVTRCRALLEAYAAALDATAAAARALDELALAAGAPSRVLALARAARARQPDGRSQPGGTTRPAGPPAEISSWNGRIANGQAGPVEQAIRKRGVTDPVALLRAAAIDNAAWRLITSADGATNAAGPPGTRESRQRAALNAAQLAAQGFPRQKAAAAPGQQPAQPARQTPRRPVPAVRLSLPEPVAVHSTPARLP